jgi:hypothetical protein
MISDHQLKVKIYAYLISITFVGGLCIWFYVSVINAKPSAPDQLDAYVDIEQYVKSQLKAPASAEFPAASTPYTTKLNDSTYSVTSYVDAQNGFGAKIRSYYTCRITYHTNGEHEFNNLKMW